MDLRVENDAEKVIALVEEGFCPVECSIGGRSITDHLVMDHHGENSRLEGVAIRAYRDFFGSRRLAQEFVTPAPVDADSAFATAALMGVLPHPARKGEVEHMPPFMQEALTRDLTGLAELINRVDTDPIGLDLTALEYSPLLLTWQAITPSNRDDLGYLGCVAAWVNLVTSSPARLEPFLEAAKKSEVDRRLAAKNELMSRIAFGRNGGPVVALDRTRVWGFDVWYSRKGAEHDPGLASSWWSPIVLALVAQTHEITIGCPNIQVAEELLGPGGLKNVFPQLEPAGWGGREAIGGSPRGLAMTRSQLLDAARAILAMVS